MPSRLVTTAFVAIALLALVSCSSAVSPRRVQAETTLPLYKRLLNASDLPEGWLLAESFPDRPIVADLDPTEAPCDGNYSEELGSHLERTIASRTFVNDGSILHQSLITDVGAEHFDSLTDAIAACDGVAGTSTVNGLPADVVSTGLDLGLPHDTVAMTVLVATDYDASLSVWMYARARDATLLTVSISFPNRSTSDLAALLKQAIRKARGAWGRSALDTQRHHDGENRPPQPEPHEQADRDLLRELPAEPGGDRGDHGGHSVDE